MAQATAIVINDGQATPVSTSFTPEMVTPALSTFVDRSSGIASRFRRLSLRFGLATRQNKRNTADFSVAIPVVGTLPSGAIGVLRTLRAKVNFELPEDSTPAERSDLFAFVANGLQDSLVKGMLKDLDPLY